MADPVVVGGLIAIGGVLAGGGVNLALDLIKHRRERRSRKEELRREKLETAFSLLYRIDKEISYYRTNFEKALRGGKPDEFPFHNGLPVLDVKTLLTLYGTEFDADSDELMITHYEFQVKIHELAQAYIRTHTIDPNIKRKADDLASKVFQIRDRIQKRIVKIFREELEVS
jgi:hypothetical protein